tara:strand:+ start:228 stop:1541 length:1314 start_codon:yes stop_codon:yes gene_type:complete
MASAYLERTATSGNQKTATFSGWFKKCSNGVEQVFYHMRTDSSNFFRIRWDSNDILNGASRVSGTDYYVTATRKFRDTSAYYHIVFKVDTTQATASDRLKLYVNGEEVTVSASNYPAQNLDLQMNVNSMAQRVGQENGGNYFDGLMTHIHWTDGNAYDASDFGETDSTSGIWKPKTSPSVTYGSNGFFLKMENSGAMGTDSSGNTNTFTVSGTLTQTEDTPSNNFATLNPLIQSGVGTLTNGNLTHSSSSGIKHIISSFGITKGKWYAEAKYTGGGNYNGVGFVSEPILPTTTAWYNSPYAAILTYTNVYNNGSGLGTYATPSTNDIIGIAVDADNGFIYFSNNGTFGNSGVPTSGATGTGGIATSVFSGNTNTIFFASEQDATPGTRSAEWNFGNGYFGTTAVASSNSDSAGLGLFEYSVPSGYYALCTKNIKNYG